MYRILFSRPVLLFLLLSSVYSWSSIPTSSSNDSLKHEFYIQFIDGVPLLWHGNDGSQIESNARDLKLNYNLAHRFGGNMNVEIYHNPNDYTIRDSTHTSASLVKEYDKGLKLRLNQTFRNDAVSLYLDMSDLASLNQFIVNYRHNWKYIAFSTGYESKRILWAFTLWDVNSSIPAKIEYHRSTYTLGALLNSHWGDLAVTINASAKPILPNMTFDGLGTTLEPVHAEFEVSYYYQLENAATARIFYNNSSDTLNTDIKSDADIIGKLYAFDDSHQQLGLSYEQANLSHMLIYHKIYGRISGYVRAAYFSDLLTTLSGARFYQQGELNATFLEYRLSHKQQYFGFVTLNINNSLISGTADIYSKHYVFLLFNPLTDLAIQTIKLHAFVADRFSLRIESEVVRDVVLELGVDYTLPLYLDWEAHPEIDLETTGFRLGYQLNMLLKYSF